MENLGIDPSTSRILSKHSTIGANYPNYKSIMYTLCCLQSSENDKFVKSETTTQKIGLNTML